MGDYDKKIWDVKFQGESVLGTSGVRIEGPNMVQGEVGSHVADQVRSSTAFIQAHEEFSKAGNELWLQRLESIVSAVKDPASVFPYMVSDTNKRNAIYQDAIVKIQNLLQEYQEYIISRPVNQVSEYNLAGINSAITGQGVTGATFEGQPAQPMDAGFLSEDPGRNQARSTFSNLASFAVNLYSGYLGMFKAVSDISVRKRAQDMEQNRWLQNFTQTNKVSFNAFKMSLMDRGVDLGSINSWSDFGSFNPRSSASFNRERLSEIIQSGELSQQYGHILNYMSRRSDGFDDYFSAQTDGDGNLIGYSLGEGMPSVDMSLSPLADTMYKLHQRRLKFENEIQPIVEAYQQYKLLNEGELANQYLSGQIQAQDDTHKLALEQIQNYAKARELTDAEILNLSDQHILYDLQKKIQEFENHRKELLNGMIDRWYDQAKNGNTNSYQMLIQALMNENLYSDYEKKFGVPASAGSTDFSDQPWWKRRIGSMF